MVAASTGLSSEFAGPERTSGSHAAPDALCGAGEPSAAALAPPVRGRVRAPVRAHRERTRCRSGCRRLSPAAHSALRRASATRRGGPDSDSESACRIGIPEFCSAATAAAGSFDNESAIILTSLALINLSLNATLRGIL